MEREIWYKVLRDRKIAIKIWSWEKRAEGWIDEIDWRIEDSMWKKRNKVWRREERAEEAIIWW